MKKGLALAAGIAATIVATACATERILAPPMQFTTTSSFEVMNPTTRKLEAVTLPPMRNAPGVSASVAASSPTPVMMAFNAPGTSTHGGSRQFPFISKDGHPSKIVFLYGPNGGPPAAVQSYCDKKLVSTDAYKWTATAAGWMQSSSVLSVVSAGVLVGRVTTTTVLCHTNCGPPQMVQRGHVIGAVAYALMNATALPAQAQWYNMSFGACSAEWGDYSSAVALFMVLSSGAGAAPEMTVAIAVGLAAAEQAVLSTEAKLVSCMARQPDAADSAANGGSSGGSAGGGAGSSDCLEGSYAAHCTTPFTL